MSENTQAKIGKLITGEEYRDAIHVAVAPIVAARRLRPGQHVGLDKAGKGTDRTEEPIGVVDPFLIGPALPGEKFWLFLYPNTIQSLRHEWTHPAFAGPALPPPTSEPTKAKSEAWLREFCSMADCPGYDVVMKALRGESLNEGYGEHATVDDESLFFYGRDAHGDIPDEFWIHAENVLGKLEYKPKYFSCSC